MDVDVPATHCYCESLTREAYMLQCQLCKRYYHPRCLEIGPPSTLIGDMFFKFICSNCTGTGREVCERLKIQWMQALLLTMYNLQLQGGGKLGYFRWREHICGFIDKNWNLLFGGLRKKTTTWHGTIAGALSGGANTLFRSGTAELGESGWWALMNPLPPTVPEIEKLIATHRANRRTKNSTSDSSPKVEGLRHRGHKNAMQAAIELKEKRSIVQQDVKKQVWLDEGEASTSAAPPEMDMSESNMYSMLDWPSCSSFDVTSTDSEANVDVNSIFSPTTTIKQEPMETDELIDIGSTSLGEVGQKDKDLLDIQSQSFKEAFEQKLLNDSDNEYLEVDVEDDPSITPLMLGSDLPDIEDIVSTIGNKGISDIKEEKTDDVTIKNEDPDPEELACQFNSPDGHDKEGEANISDSEENADAVVASTARKKKATSKEEETDAEVEQPPKCLLMSVYEEHLLLKRLETLSDAVEVDPKARRLRRKLLVRRIKRERNLPVFDFDTEVASLCHPDSLKDRDSTTMTPTAQPVMPQARGYQILDRYQLTGSLTVKSGHSHRYCSFITRLMGLEEEQLESIVSPYTSRILKPFIFRDYDTVPLKLRLLQEIIQFPHRNDPSWKPPPRHPIDFCYVRPEHIPVVNSLCREFFWPGIDMSECLQYPDFSCIALYRKAVIGFGFMVPDVKYNEAYISFLFTHPEWRNAGIATFMIYHLIQTCMGKDVTLHVSATNPSLLLYQKFGFKVEEFILDFYEKYFPADSKECRHALFLRLSR